MSHEPARWTQEQVDEHMRRMHPEIKVTVLPDAPAKRVTARAKKMNATEAAWSQELSKRGYSARWEAITLKLANDCRYTPDFCSEGLATPCFWEVKRQWKGTKRPHIEDDALFKLKVAAHTYSEFVFWLVWLLPDGTWREERIEPVEL